MLKSMIARFGLVAVALTLLASGLFLLGGSASAENGNAGVVYTESNASSGNAVLIYQRAADGTLAANGSISTGGLGTGSGLGSQGALALTAENHWLIAVNAGSNDVSVIALSNGKVASRVSSGGIKPVGVTVHENLVYALNAGNDTISGFWLKPGGQLSPIPGSTQPLSATNAGGAQISFVAEGQVLVVTEKNTNKIDTYTVGANGVATGPTTHASSGAVPFGFAVSKDDTLVVSEAAANAASSYQVSANGNVNLITGSVANGQQAPCWVAVTRNGRYAYTADAHNGTISSYGLSSNGQLTLIQGAAAVPGGGPLDESISRNDKFLYVLNPKAGLIDIFHIEGDGSLAALTNAVGIPTSAAGLIAR